MNKFKKLMTISLISMIFTGCSIHNDGVDKNKIEEEKEKEVPNQVSKIENVDYSEFFDGIIGCAVFYDVNKNQYNIYNDELANEKKSPCSTFKIISTIMGLDTGVVSSVNDKMGYDGTLYSNDEWNGNLNLDQAFKKSCVWYYKKLISQMDEEYVQDMIDKLDYGNRDITVWDDNGHNDFWLESTLKISPKEQVDILYNIFENKTDINDNYIKITKKLMETENSENIKIYGKTGMGTNTESKNTDAWFVGIAEPDDNKIYFAVKLDDKKSNYVSSKKSKEIAIDIINKFYQ